MQLEKDNQSNTNPREEPSRFGYYSQLKLNVEGVATFALGKTGTLIPPASEQTACPFLIVAIEPSDAPAPK